MILSTASVESAGDNQYMIAGVLDFESVPILMRELKPLLKNKNKAIFSFSAVNKCNSAGLALLLEITRIMRDKDIQFKELPTQMTAVAKAYGVEDELKTQGLII